MEKLLVLIALTGVSACGPKSTIEAVDYSCTIEAEYIVCPDGTKTYIPQDGIDGRDGRDGIDGAPGQNGDDGRDGIDGNDGNDGTMIDVIDPCGDGPGQDEVLLRFDDGTILAWYKNLGFSVLQENTSYQTTDAQKCNFRIIGGKVVSQ